MGHSRPVAPDRLAAELIRDLPGGTCRVALDGPPCANPGALAEQIVDELRGRRPTGHIRAETYWRDASLRLEYGREDVESYLHWLDADALRREALEPSLAAGRYLPSLRDPLTNRSTRVSPLAAPPGTVLLVSGAFLLGRDLPFDRGIHLALSAAARARRTLPEQAWTLPAFARYDTEVRPAEAADVVVRYDDPRHPALSGRIEA